MTIKNKTNKFLKKLSKIKEIKDPNEVRFNIVKLQNQILAFYIRVHKPHPERIIKMVGILDLVHK